MPRKKAAPLPDGIPEYAVDHDTLMQFFRPPVSKSTFYKLQKEGYIAALEGVSGRYRLNTSLINLGLNPVAALPPDSVNEKDALQLALWLVAPDAVHAPPVRLDEDALNPELESRAILLALWHYRHLQGLPTEQERRAYAEGAFDADYVIRKDQA